MTSPPPPEGGFPGRDAILGGALESLAEDAAGRNATINSVETRTAIKRAMLARAPAGEDVWVFGYGSLIWNPAFNFAESQVARLYGYHRQFCFWSVSGRGTPERPGLMLALEPGGSCHGVAFRVAAAEADTELQSVFLREMFSSSYHPRWVRLRLAGRSVPAITFVANHDHPNYAGAVPFEEAAGYIAQASGKFGPCRDYLVNTVRHLDELNISDRRMHRLLALVEARAEG